MIRTTGVSRRLRLLLFTLLLGVVACAATPGARGDEAGERITEADYQRINDALVRHHVLPRYRLLSEATIDLREATGALCASPPDLGAVEAAGQAFHRTMDVWMAIQHLNFGPLEQEARFHRVYFWPQARGKVGEAIDVLLAAGDPDRLSPERFARASAAAQGLPAAEHLLFVRGDAFSGGGRTASPECRVLEAIAGNLASIAKEALEEWTAAPTGGALRSYADLMLMPGPDNPDFPVSKDATLLFFSALHTGLSLITEVRVTPLLGDGLASARPALAESRPSGRSTRNAEINLRAMQALYAGEAGAPGLGELVAAQEQDADLDPLMRKAFRLTLESAQAIDASLDEAVTDSSLRPRVEKLSLQVRALRQLVRTRVAEALDLAVGFNALDGD